MSPIARVMVWLLAAVAGAVFGVVGTVAQATSVGPVPLGLVLALAGSGALVLAIRLLVGRGAAVVAAVVLTLVIAVLSGRGTGGSVIAPADDPRVWIWAVAAPLIAAVIVAWPSLPQTRGAAAPAA